MKVGQLFWPILPLKLVAMAQSPEKSQMTAGFIKQLMHYQPCKFDEDHSSSL